MSDGGDYFGMNCNSVICAVDGSSMSRGCLTGTVSFTTR